MSKPKVTIVMAIYRPELNYLNKQLKSINNQTYSNIELIICDDSGSLDYIENIKESLNRNIINFQFTLVKNLQNLGSNKTFEKLTHLATGDYISYADQDDIWEKNKIENLVKAIVKENGNLVYSNLALINERDELISTSFKNSNFRLEHVSGEGCFFRFLRRNSVTGCAMLIKTEIAKKYLPFPGMSIYPHDHWLAIMASINGLIVYVNEPLVKYRIHAENQIGNKRFININNIEDYYYERIFMQQKRLKYIANFIGINQSEKKWLLIELDFLNARKDYLQLKNTVNLIKLFKFFKYDFVLVMFEIILGLVPRKFSRIVFKILKR